MKGRLLAIFAAALAIRWCYALVLYSNMGDAALMGVDSYTYVDVAQKFAAAIAAHDVRGLGWLGSQTVIMPLFNMLVSCSMLVGGAHGVITYVLIQCIFDAATCVIVALTARAIRPDFAVPAGIVAALNPTQIVISGLVYPDTPFVFFVAVTALGAVLWLRRPSLGSAAGMTLGLIGAESCRILILPWLFILAGMLLVTLWLRKQLTLRAAAPLLAMTAVVAGCTTPVLVRNVQTYGAWSLTSQEGGHLFTVVPWVRQAYDGTPWAVGHDDLVKEEQRRFPVPSDNPFEESRRWSGIALQAWRSYGLVPTIKAWAYGAVIDLAAPGVLLSPPVIQIPRTGFYDAPGRSMAEKIRNFLFHSESATYLWVLLVAASGLFIVRLVQAVGAIALLQEARTDARLIPVVTMFLLWFAFILAVNGPIATPKYRLPLEPMFDIVTATGFCKFSSRRYGA